MTAYPAHRARLDSQTTYKLDPLDRDIVGVLQMWGLWSNSSIGRAYGIDRAAVSRHGARMRIQLRWEWDR